jgi:hypothetical protein
MLVIDVGAGACHQACHSPADDEREPQRPEGGEDACRIHRLLLFDECA